jgi:hypothetical protein
MPLSALRNAIKSSGGDPFTVDSTNTKLQKSKNKKNNKKRKQNESECDTKCNTNSNSNSDSDRESANRYKAISVQAKVDTERAISYLQYLRSKVSLYLIHEDAAQSLRNLLVNPFESLCDCSEIT